MDYSLRVIFAQNKKKGDNIAALNKELYSEAERLDIVDKAPYVLTEVLLSENILKDLAACRVIFLRVSIEIYATRLFNSICVGIKGQIVQEFNQAFNYIQMLLKINIFYTRPLQFCRKNHKSQKNFLCALELLICQRFPDTLLPKTAHILMALYENDIVEEEILIDWQSKVENISLRLGSIFWISELQNQKIDSKPHDVTNPRDPQSSKKRLGKEMAQQLHNKAAPFIKWLQTAEEETGSEDEDEEAAPEVSRAHGVGYWVVGH